MFEVEEGEFIIRSEAYFYYFLSCFILIWLDLPLIASLYIALGVSMVTYTNEDRPTDIYNADIRAYKSDWVIADPYVPDLLTPDDLFALFETGPENFPYSNIDVLSQKFINEFEEKFSEKKIDRFHFINQSIINKGEEFVFRQDPSLLRYKLDVLINLLSQSWMY